MNKWYHYDLVIIGAGMAGMSAALRASELGLKVAVLERGVDERYLCNTRWSGGVLHVAFRDVKAGPESILESIVASTSGSVDLSLARVLAGEAGRAVDWLGMHGAKYIRFGQVEWQRWMLAPPRRIAAGHDWQGRGPDYLLRTMLRSLVERGGAVHLGTAATGLLERGGVCVGAQAQRIGGAVEKFHASAVLLADGGFQGDLELLRSHVCPTPEKLHQRGPSTGVGDGLRMAKALGAHTGDLSYFYGHLLSRDAFANPSVWPYPQVDELGCAGIVVDGGGRRFADEGLGGVFLANAVAKLQDPLSAWAIFDQAIWDGPGKAARIPANPHLVHAGATVLQGDSLGELAVKAGLPSDALQTTVEGLRQAIRSGTLHYLDPVRTIRAHGSTWLLNQPPYYAVPVCAGITYTLGGISIDEHGRVTDRNADPIEGLYAAGASTAGLEGVKSPGYVGGLMKGLVFGLRAAEHVFRTANGR